MIIPEEHKAAFAEYEKPLEHLEKSFNRAGLFVRFYCFVAPANNKMVSIENHNGVRIKLACIEGDSPAQAVKDVAAGVRL